MGPRGSARTSRWAARIGVSGEARGDTHRASGRELREHELDVLLVGGAVDVRYLCGFTGTNGLALVLAEPDATPRFYTDFRYATQSAEQVPASFAREIVSIDLLEAAVARA